MPNSNSWQASFLCASSKNQLRLWPRSSGGCQRFAADQQSRAQYWQGRAYEALGDTSSALSPYRQAALYPETFYGQLALARIDRQPRSHLSGRAVEAVATGAVEDDALMPQIKILAESGPGRQPAPVRGRDVEAYPSPPHQAADDAFDRWGYPEIAVRWPRA
jgi:soluble lytic murein transglycosylase